MGFYEEAIRKIEAQQPKVRNTVWLCAEQMKEILREDPALAGIVAQDLDNSSMSVAACEKKIKEAARGFGGGLTGPEAEGIIRRFYGLPERGGQYDQRVQPDGEKKVIDLADFF